MLKIYNTLTKKKEKFKPINPPNVKMYMCGPTVYDYFHIGNARSFVMSDIIRRYLEYRGYKVKFVMNITDVDDKIIKKAQKEKTDTDTVADKYTRAFLDDLDLLKVKKADEYPKATEHMDDIINMIEKLVLKDFAYNIDGNVFYDVHKFLSYGKLSGKNINELEAGSRVEINEVKLNPLDFSLWKKAKEGEPSWESPWGKGRPGWHIECSAMSCRHLGDTFDIHAGGNDLIFPHHENEIAQSEAANGKPFVHYWIHFGFLNINEEKMSKSLGNFFTTRELLKKFSAESLRLLYAQTHYGGPLNFTDELLKSAEKGLEKVNNLVDKINEELKQITGKRVDLDFDFEKYKHAFEAAMDDDFNSPKATAVIFDFVKDVNRAIAENDKLSLEFYYKVKEFLSKTAEGILGIIKFDPNETTGDARLENQLIDLLIKLRVDAKNNKNYELSDNIRDSLKELGIILQDTKEGTTFKKLKK